MGTPAVPGGLCSLGYRAQPPHCPARPWSLMDLVQKLHFEPDSRVAGKLVLPQSAAGRQGRGRGWHTSCLCPEAMVEGPTLVLPRTPCLAQPPGSGVPLEGMVLGEAKRMETVSPERHPRCKNPTLQPMHHLLGAGKLARPGAAKPRDEAAPLQHRLDSLCWQRANPLRLFINKENRQILLKSRSSHNSEALPSSVAFGSGCRAP